MTGPSQIDENFLTIQLLLTLHDSVQTAKILKLSQSAVSRRFTSCEKVLGLQVIRKNYRYRLVSSGYSFDAIASGLADLRLDQQKFRWSHSPSISEKQANRLQRYWYLDTSETHGELLIAKLIKDRVLDLYFMTQSDLNRFLEVKALDGISAIALPRKDGLNNYSGDQIYAVGCDDLLKSDNGQLGARAIGSDLQRLQITS